MSKLQKAAEDYFSYEPDKKMTLDDLSEEVDQPQLGQLDSQEKSNQLYDTFGLTNDQSEYFTQGNYQSPKPDQGLMNSMNDLKKRHEDLSNSISNYQRVFNENEASAQTFNSQSQGIRPKLMQEVQKDNDKLLKDLNSGKPPKSSRGRYKNHLNTPDERFSLTQKPQGKKQKQYGLHTGSKIAYNLESEFSLQSGQKTQVLSEEQKLMKEQLTSYKQKLSNIEDELFKTSRSSQSKNLFSKTSLNTIPQIQSTANKQQTSRSGFSPLKTMQYLESSSSKYNSRFKKDRSILEQIEMNRSENTKPHESFQDIRLRYYDAFMPKQAKVQNSAFKLFKYKYQQKQQQRFQNSLSDFYIIQKELDKQLFGLNKNKDYL